MYNWQEKREKKAFLALENGEIFRGYSAGAPIDMMGEVVFNTSMSAYEEIVSNPAYAGQLVALTAPEIGNCGTNEADMESRGLFLSGLIVHELNLPSNFRSEQALTELLKSYGVPLLAGVDVRRLTLSLAANGSQKAFLHCDGTELSTEEAVQRAQSFAGLSGADYASSVTVDEPYTYNENGSCHAVALDFGITHSQLRFLEAADIKVSVLPAYTTAEEILRYKPDGLFLPSGPADPSAAPQLIDTVRELTGKLPVMGLGFGSNILSLALGAKVSRLKFGHHGANHPVKSLLTGRVEITSQNHNFTVLIDGLPPCLEVTHVNLNDNTVEGVRHKTEPVFGVQYNPGTLELFEEFKAMMGR